MRWNTCDDHDIQAGRAQGPAVNRSTQPPRPSSVHHAIHYHFVVGTSDSPAPELADRIQDALSLVTMSCLDDGHDHRGDGPLTSAPGLGHLPDSA